MNKLTKDNLIHTIKNSKNLGSLSRSLSNNKELLDIVIEKTSFLLLDSDLKKRYFHIKNDLIKIETCMFCDDDVFWSNKNKYLETCDNKKCRNSYKSYILNKEENKNKHSESIKKFWKNLDKKDLDKSIKKREQTNLKKYGKKSYAQTKEFKENMIKNYGYISPFELEETHKKSKKTLESRYKVNHNFKIPDIQDKITKTFNKKYGTDRPSQNLEIKSKGIKTCNEKYGGNSPMCSSIIMSKSLETLYKNYEVYSPLQSKIILKRYEDTMMERYGYKYYIQNVENLEKLLKKSYLYKKIKYNGSIINLQGYEDYVLFEILSKEYTSIDIKIELKDIKKYTGNIKYSYKDKERNYYPDFYIKSINKVYEVKSNYTYNKQLEVNNLKRDACLKKGIQFEFLIINDRIYKEWKKQNKIK